MAQMWCLGVGCGRGEAAGGGGPSAAEGRLVAVGRGSGGGAGWGGRWRGGCAGLVEKCDRGCRNPMILDVCGAVWVFIGAVSKRWLSGRRRTQVVGEVFPSVAGGGGRGQVEDGGAGGRGGGFAPGAWAAGGRSVLRRTNGTWVAGAVLLWDGFGRYCGGLQGAGVAGFVGRYEGCLRGCVLWLRRDDCVEIGAASGAVLGVAESGEFGGRGCGGWAEFGG